MQCLLKLKSCISSTAPNAVFIETKNTTHTDKKSSHQPCVLSDYGHPAKWARTIISEDEKVICVNVNG